MLKNGDNVVAGDVLTTTVFSIVFSLIAAYIAIAFILPMVRALVKEIIEEPQAVGGFMSILVIVVYVLLFKKIIEVLAAIPIEAPVVEEGAEVASTSILSYLGVLEPGIEILDSLLPYIGWVLLGSLIAFGLRHYFKKD